MNRLSLLSLIVAIVALGLVIFLLVGSRSGERGATGLLNLWKLFSSEGGGGGHTNGHCTVTYGAGTYTDGSGTHGSGYYYNNADFNSALCTSSFESCNQ